MLLQSGKRALGAEVAERRERGPTSPQWATTAS
jgi:hypothetical protein